MFTFPVDPYSAICDDHTIQPRLYDILSADLLIVERYAMEREEGIKASLGVENELAGA